MKQTTLVSLINDFPIESKSINIYIYIHTHIYKSKDLMQESMRSCHVAHFMKIIEILLSHIRDKNKFKNKDFLFLLVQCFKTTFCFLLINISRLLFVSFGLIFQDFPLSLTHTHTKLFTFSFTLHSILSQIHFNQK